MHDTATWGARFGAAGTIVMLALSACTSGSGGVGAPGVTATAQSYCDGREARTAKCSGDSGVAPTGDAGASIRSSCEKDYRCKAAIFVAADVYFSCRQNQDCSASAGDDFCTAKAGEGRSTADRDACLAKREQCKAAGQTFSDDNCGLLPALNAQTAQKVMGCVNLPCDQVKACFSDLDKQVPECN